MNEIIDGEIHALDKQYAYMVDRVQHSTQELDDIYRTQRSLMYRYIEYLMKNDSQKVKKLLFDKLMKGVILNEGNEDCQFTFRPPWMCGALAQSSLVALKFKRAEKDNLGENND